LLARSPNSRPLLIAAISGRALAAAARRAGYRPFVADLFRDSDTVALAERAIRIPGSLQTGIDGEQLVTALKELAGDEEPEALVYGSGFEGRPDLLDELAQHFPLAGSPAKTVRRLKDPEALAADCAALGIPHPPISWDMPPDPENWMIKKVGGAGGSHVRRASDASTGPGTYFQRYIRGRNVSALFIADGRSAQIVGFSRQWASPIPTAPYRYGGAVRLKRFDMRQAQKIGGWLSGLTARTGLIGLCSADFIRAGDDFHLVEVNPRPGATLDIFDSEQAPLVKAHLEAGRGKTAPLPRFADSMASMIVYARRATERFPAIAWPEWVSDRQMPGTRLLSGDPVCTAFAWGPNAAAARRAVMQLARQIQDNWEGCRT